MKCDKCGNDMLDLSGPSAMYTFRCPQCAHEVGGVADGMEILSLPRPAWVRMFVAWEGGRATPVQVARLRTLFPTVASQSIGQVVASAGCRLIMPLGRFRQWEADQLVTKGNALDLDLRYERIPHDADGNTPP